ncbi:MAG: V-type ATP synthase subunit I [Candidatus Aminicenantes bacterium]
MALAEVLKVQILAYADVKLQLLSNLQEEGLIQLEEAGVEKADLHTLPAEVSQIDHRLHRLNHVLGSLSLWEERGFVKSLLGQKPQLQTKEREKALHFDYLSVVEKVEQIEKEKNELTSEIKFFHREEEFISPLKGLELPIKSLAPTYSTEIRLGWLPLPQLQAFRETAEDEPLWYKVIHQGKKNVHLVLIYHKKEKERLEQVCKELNFTPLHFSDHTLNMAEQKDRVEDVMTKIREEKERRRSRLEALEKKGQELLAYRDKLMLAHDVLLNEKQKISTSRLLGATERVCYLEGWMRSADIQKLRSNLHPLSDYIEIYTRPPLPEEEPPVILENPRPARPFEMVTKLYGLPRRKSLDPTLALAPFFFLFVGLCVSEAGYGLLVAVLSFLYIKFAKPRGGLLQFMKLLSLLGISTVIMGTLVGGWFGFPVRQLMILDPLQDPLSFLILSLILGFVQVWFGTLLNLINGLKNKLYLQSICVQGGWLVLLPSLVLYFLTKGSEWGILALAGAAGIVFFGSPSRNPISRFFGGLYKLYDISRYLADVLSYSRLLALGLATSVIAMVVNTLCQTAWEIPWVGWLLAALIFVGGHLFNLGISYLGGFVHSMRLQFVEFFSKFFQSGGKPFKPLELESKYVEFI